MKFVIIDEKKNPNISKFDDHYGNDNSVDGLINVNLDNISFVFSILSIGYCFSLLILVIEMAMEWFNVYFEDIVYSIISLTS